MNKSKNLQNKNYVIRLICADVQLFSSIFKFKALYIKVRISVASSIFFVVGFPAPCPALL